MIVEPEKPSKKSVQYMMKKTPEEILRQLRKNVQSQLRRAETEEDLIQRKEVYLSFYELKYGSLATKVWEELACKKKFE